MKAIAAILTTLFLLVAGLPAQAQIQLLTNGGLETWGTLNASNQGTPASWSTLSSTIAPTRVAGLVSGSNYAAMLQYGANNTLGPNVSGAAGNPKQFQLDFVFAATDPGSASNRSLNFNMNQSLGASPALNFRTVQGASGVGFLNIQAFNGSAWKDVAIDLLATADLTVGAGGAGMNAYNFSLSVDFAAGSYSLSYGLVSSSMVNAGTFTYFQSNNGNGLTSLGFLNNSGATNKAYAIDNVSLLAVPEPGALALLALGLCTLLRVSRRKLA